MIRWRKTSYKLNPVLLFEFYVNINVKVLVLKEYNEFIIYND